MSTCLIRMGTCFVDGEVVRKTSMGSILSSLSDQETVQMGYLLNIFDRWQLVHQVPNTVNKAIACVILCSYSENECWKKYSDIKVSQSEHERFNVQSSQCTVNVWVVIYLTRRVRFIIISNVLNYQPLQQIPAHTIETNQHNRNLQHVFWSQPWSKPRLPTFWYGDLPTIPTSDTGPSPHWSPSPDFRWTWKRPKHHLSSGVQGAMLAQTIS